MCRQGLNRPLVKYYRLVCRLIHLYHNNQHNIFGYSMYIQHKHCGNRFAYYRLKNIVRVEYLTIYERRRMHKLTI